MSYKFQRYCIWSGIAFFVLFGVACFSLAHFIPPPSPSLTGQELLALYESNAFGVRMAMVVAMIAAMALVPWSAVLYAQMARIETDRVPVMSVSAFGAGVVNSVAFLLPFIFWSAAVYRMDRNPEIIQFISDMAWLEFVMVFAPFFLQTALIAIVGLQENSTTPTFPRWFCFMSFWVCILVIPGGFAVFFKSGPFAWNGLFAFWIPVTVFTFYYISIFTLLFKAIKRQELSDPGRALRTAIAV